MLEVWETTFWTSAKTIDVHLGWLRRKLGDDTRRPTLITTIRGRGLRFEVDPPVYDAVRGPAVPVAQSRLLTYARGRHRLRPSRGPASAPADAPVLAVIGGGQLARMMAQAAVGARRPAAAARRGPRTSSAAQVVPDTLGRGLPRPRDAARGRRRLRGGHLRPRARPDRRTSRRSTAEGHACRPGPGRPGARPGQGRDAGAARRPRRPVPAARGRDATADDVAGSPPSVGGFPVVLKTTRGGYDGKGVWVVGSADEAADAFETAGAHRRPDARRGEGRLPPRAVRAGGPLAVRPGRGVPGRRVGAARRRSAGRSSRPRPTSPTASRSRRSRSR